MVSSDPDWSVEEHPPGGTPRPVRAAVSERIQLGGPEQDADQAYEQELFLAVQARLRSPEEYVRYQMLLAEPLVRRLEQLLPDDARHVLEVGCGTGGISLYLASQGFRVAAVDRQQYDSDALPAARRYAVGHGIELDLSQADAVALPFESATFDCVVCSNVVEHLEDPSTAIAEIHRVLKPGGLALVDFPLFHSTYGGHIEGSIKIPWFHLLPERWVAAVLRRRGAERDLAVFRTLSGISNRRFRRIVRRVGFEVRDLRRAHYLTHPGRKLAAALLDAARHRSPRRAVRAVRTASSEFTLADFAEFVFLAVTVPCSYIPVVGEFFASGVKYVLRRPGPSEGFIGGGSR